MIDLLELLAGENKEIYIMGDMNIDLFKLNEHWKTGECVENIFTHGFIPFSTNPTRITDHSATLIDHIYTNRTDTNMTSGIITTDISDHFRILHVLGGHETTIHILKLIPNQEHTLILTWPHLTDC